MMNIIKSEQWMNSKRLLYMFKDMESVGRKEWFRIGESLAPFRITHLWKPKKQLLIPIQSICNKTRQKSVKERASKVRKPKENKEKGKKRLKQMN